MRKASTTEISESDPTDSQQQHQIEVNSAMATLTIQEQVNPPTENEAKDSQQVDDQVNTTTMSGVTFASSQRSSKKRSHDEISNELPGEPPICEQQSKRRRDSEHNLQDQGDVVNLIAYSQKASKPRGNNHTSD